MPFVSLRGRKWNSELYLRSRTMRRQVKDLGQVVGQCLWGIGGKCESIKQVGGSQ